MVRFVRSLSFLFALVCVFVAARVHAERDVVAPRSPPAGAAAEVLRKISWLRSTSEWGHTGVKIEAKGRVIYIDPVGLVRIEELPKADLILITHEHADHMSFDTIDKLSKGSTEIVSTPLVVAQLDLPRSRAVAPGQTIDVMGMKIAAVHAYNDHHAKVLGHVGYVFAIDGVRVYFSSDTGLTPEMKALADIDIAFVNIRDRYSLSGGDVVAFAAAVKPKILVPIHWMPDSEGSIDKDQVRHVIEHAPKGTFVSVLELL